MEQKRDVKVSTDSASVNSDEVPDGFSNLAEASIMQKTVRRGLIESKYDIEVQRKDPNSPLYSVKSFEALKL